jgi:hypothetical protein
LGILKLCGDKNKKIKKKLNRGKKKKTKKKKKKKRRRLGYMQMLAVYKIQYVYIYKGPSTNIGEWIT